MIGDEGQNLVQIEFRIEAIEFGRAEQGVDLCSPLATCIRSRKEIILSSKCDHAQRAFGGIIVDLELAVIEVARECTELPPVDKSSDCGRFSS